MEIKFSNQAQKIISQLENKDKVIKELTELAEKRCLWITGGDIIRYLIEGKLLENISER